MRSQRVRRYSRAADLTPEATHGGGALNHRALGWAGRPQTGRHRGRAHHQVALGAPVRASQELGSTGRTLRLDPTGEKEGAATRRSKEVAAQRAGAGLLPAQSPAVWHQQTPRTTVHGVPPHPQAE